MNKEIIKVLIAIPIFGLAGYLWYSVLSDSEESDKSELTVCECYEMSHSDEEIRLDDKGNAYYNYGQVKDRFMSKAADALLIGTADAIEEVEKLEEKYNDLCFKKMFPDKMSEKIRVREELAKCK